MIFLRRNILAIYQRGARQILSIVVFLFLVGWSQLSNSKSMNLDFLISDLKEWVGAELNVSSGAIKVPALDARTRVGYCEAPIFDFPFANRKTIRARCKSPQWQLFFRISVGNLDSVVIAKKNILAGEIFTELNVAYGSARRSIRGAISDIESVLGKEARSDIKVADVILKTKVAETVVVYKLKQTVPEGGLLDTENTVSFRMNVSNAPPNAFRGPLDLVDRKARQRLHVDKILLNSDILVHSQVVVVSKNISAGTLLDSSMLKLKKIDSKKVVRDQITNIEGLEKRETTRALKAGEPLRLSDTQTALLIKKGDIVVISIGKKGKLMVSASMTALENGRFGQQIKVRNNDSGKVVRGIVSGKNAVEGI